MLTRIGEHYLAVVGLEVGEAEIGPQADLVSGGIEGIGQPPAAGGIAPPLDEDAPEARVQGVGIAESDEIGHHDLNSGLAEVGELRRRIASIDVIDGVGHEHDGHFGLALPGCDQGRDDFRAERSVRDSAGAEVLVEEKEIEHQQSSRSPDQIKDLVEDRLFGNCKIIGIAIGEIGEESEIGAGNGDGITREDQVLGQGFDGLVAADGRPGTRAAMPARMTRRRQVEAMEPHPRQDRLGSLELLEDRCEESRVVAHDSGGAGAEEDAGLLGVVHNPVVGADPEDPAALEKAAAVEPDRPDRRGIWAAWPWIDPPRQSERGESQRRHLGSGQGGSAPPAEPTGLPDEAVVKARDGDAGFAVVSGEHLEKGLDRGWIVRFEIDADGRVRESARGTPVRVGTASPPDVQSADLLQFDLGNLFVAARDAGAVGIVGDDEVAVGGAVDIELQGVGAVRQGDLEG